MTSFPGMGTILLATLYGGLVCFPSPFGLVTIRSADGSGAPELDSVVGRAPTDAGDLEKIGRAPAVADVTGKSGILARQSRKSMSCLALYGNHVPVYSRPERPHVDIIADRRHSPGERTYVPPARNFLNS